MSLLFQAVLLAAAFLVTAFRYEIQFTQKGAELLLGHFVIYSLWIFSMAMLINLLALFFGSSSAFIAVYSIQICLILSFWFCHFCQDDLALTSRILRANPASRLVMGWMGRSEYGNLSIPGSILLMGLIALGVSLAGGWIVKRKELLISISRQGECSMELIADHISKTIRGKKILSDISLSLSSGRIYGFSGRNGSGKTMLFRALSGLMSVTSGTVSWGGKILKKDFSVLPGLGILLENVSLYPELTGFSESQLSGGDPEKNRQRRDPRRPSAGRSGSQRPAALRKIFSGNETAPGHRPGSDGAAGCADAGRAYKLPGRPGA